jgi:hypothetical protein
MAIFAIRANAIVIRIDRKRFIVDMIYLLWNDDYEIVRNNNFRSITDFNRLGKYIVLKEGYNNNKISENT